jgi:uncharacterized metal-binding protein
MAKSRQSFLNITSRFLAALDQPEKTPVQEHHDDKKTIDGKVICSYLAILICPLIYLCIKIFSTLFLQICVCCMLTILFSMGLLRISYLLIMQHFLSSKISPFFLVVLELAEMTHKIEQLVDRVSKNRHGHGVEGI